MLNMYNPETDQEAQLRKILESAQMVNPADIAGMQVSPGGIDNVGSAISGIANGPIAPEILQATEAAGNPSMASKIIDGLANYQVAPINAPPMGQLQRGGGLMPLNAPPMGPYGSSASGLLNSIGQSSKSKKDKEKDDEDGGNIDKFASLKAFLGG